MEQYALYLALKEMLLSISQDFKISFNDMDINKGNVCGIYIKAGEPSEYRTISQGHYMNHSARVQFMFQGDNSNDSLFDVLRVASKLKDSLIISSNTTKSTPKTIRWIDGELAVVNGDSEITDDEVVTVLMSLVTMLGEVDFKGKSEQGLPRYSLNFKIYYSIGGM